MVGLGWDGVVGEGGEGISVLGGVREACLTTARLAIITDILSQNLCRWSHRQGRPSPNMPNNDHETLVDGKYTENI